MPTKSFSVSSHHQCKVKCKVKFNGGKVVKPPKRLSFRQRLALVSIENGITPLEMLSQKRPKMDNPVQTSNPYDVLAKMDTEDVNPAVNSKAVNSKAANNIPAKDSAPASTPAAAPKVRKPPPIIITQKIDDPPKFHCFVKSTAKDEFRISYLNQNCIKIFCTSAEDHSKISNKLRETKIQFYTFSNQGPLFKKKVLKAAPFLTPEQVQKEIQEQLSSIPSTSSSAASVGEIKCTKLRGGKASSSSFLVTVPKTFDMGTFNKIDSLDHIKVKWERFNKKATVTQCHRCQMFGHGSTQCNRAARCVKCAGPHLTSDCEHKVRGSFTVKCCNCSQNHTANYSKCQVYVRYVESIQLKKSNQSARIPKPQPAFVKMPEQFPALRQSQKFTPTMPTFTPTPPTPQINKNLPYSATLKRRQPANQTPPTSIGIQELMDEVNKFNKLVNIQNLYACIKELNQVLPLLEGCHNSFAYLNVITEISIKHGF